MRVSMLLAAVGLVSASAAFANPAVSTKPANAAAAKPIAEQVCAACHGVDGNSVAAANPVLAGQHPEYLYKQLIEFKTGKRNNAIMLGMTAALSDDDMKNLAAYFSQQKLKPREAPDAKLQEAGGKIFRGGIAASKVPACMACHGPTGAGIPVEYPRLGAQHAGYIEAQMLAFKKGERANNNVMMDIASRMTEAEIKAVSNYIAGLR